jgi:hypothetical protein|tara:strand:- start:72 stop:596 length:525 start_codon:yes stop_codon:yes gene_type:complete
MVPIIFAGMRVASLVTPIIAKKLIRDGLGKAAPKTAQVSSSKPITSMNQLPNNLIKPSTSSKPLLKTEKRPGARTAKEGKALRERTKKNRQQIKESAPKPKEISAPKKIRRGVEAQAKIDKEIAFQSARKLREAEQVRGPINKVPSSQKGMRLPGKGETVKRRKGGIAKKTRIF